MLMNVYSKKVCLLAAIFFALMPFETLAQVNGVAEYRGERTVSLSADLGISTYRVLATGGSAGIHLGRDNLLEAYYFQGETSGGFLFGDLETRIVSLRAKYFLTRSFYATLGPAVHRVEMDLEAYNDFSGEDETKRGRFTNLSMDIAFGNRWDFKPGMFISCDWFGLLYPLRHIKTELPEGIDSEDDNDFNRLRNKLVFEVLRFSFGVAF